MFKKFIFIILLVLTCGYLFGQDADSLTQAKLDSVCLSRGHTVQRWTIYLEDVQPEVVDYPDSTVLYYYENNKQVGTLLRCQRCGRWIGLPIMNPSLSRTIWKSKKRKEKP